MDLGRRSWFLILFSVSYLGIGYGALTQPLSRSPVFIHELLPGWLRLSIWLTGSVIALFGAFGRNHPKWETAGFVGLCLPMGIRVTSYALGMIQAIYDTENRFVLITLGAAGFFTFGVILVAIMIVASWPEPHPEILRETLKYDPKTWKGDDG